MEIFSLTPFFLTYEYLTDQLFSLYLGSRVQEFLTPLNKAGLYTEISPRGGGGGGEFGVWTKEGGGGGARRAEAQWYYVRCYTLIRAPPLKYGPVRIRLAELCLMVIEDKIWRKTLGQ